MSKSDRNQPPSVEGAPRTGTRRRVAAPETGWDLWWRYWIVDHAWVRLIVPNVYRVDADLWRANQPGRRRLSRLKSRGVRSVLCLRGDNNSAPAIMEKRAAADLGLPLRFVRMRTYKLPKAEVLLEALSLLRSLPKPMLVHCKSGADRTGLMVTLYLHVLRGVPLQEARRALSWRYGHLHWNRAGIVHELLNAYEREHIGSGIGFEEWVAAHYDPERLTEAFLARPWYRRGARSA
jgi:protein tyrosine phosphatase (PTP) superfamily phosphohydrolase (DUF442 family)